MSDTWKGVPPPSPHPVGQPFSPEQEARIREIVRQEQAASDIRGRVNRQIGEADQPLLTDD